MNKRRLLLLAAVAALLLAGVGGTIAYLVTQTAPLVNTFEATNVAVEVQDDYRIKNTGNINAYIRAAVVATWQDASGNVYAQKPTVTLTAERGWTLNNADGYYYYNTPVAPSAVTDNPVVSVGSANAVNPDSSVYSLHVEILAQAIQAEGMGANGAIDAFNIAAKPTTTGN